MTSKRTKYVVGGIVGLVLVLGIGALLIFGGKKPEIVPTPTPVRVIPQSIAATPLPTTPIPTPTQAPTPTQTWSCVTINALGWSSYKSGLQLIPNAYRAIQIAGDPTIWENPPYRFINGDGEKMIDDWNQLDRVYNGDQICVDP